MAALGVGGSLSDLVLDDMDGLIAHEVPNLDV